jgi:hypothetical protein
MNSTTPTTQLTAGQKAALTRRANQGKTGPLAGPVKVERKPDVILAMVITEKPSVLAVSFVVEKAMKEGTRWDLPEHEQAFPLLTLSTWANLEGTELLGYGALRVALADMPIEQLETDLPALRRIDKVCKLNREESEDDSFAQVILTLAHHLRVSEIRVVAQDKKVTISKRGAAYITAHKLTEAFLARQPKTKAPVKAA